MTFASTSSTTVRLVAPADGRLAFERVEIPSLRSDELSVRISKSLISAGTEIAKLRGLTRCPGTDAEDPLPLGYSAAGVVVAVGSPSVPFIPGDRVSAHAPHASYAAVDPEGVSRLPANVSFEEGAFDTLAALGLHAVRCSQLEVGQSCAVVGFGLVGQLIALCARVAGARHVGILEHRASRRALAARLGFDVAEPSSFDIVFEAAGTPSALRDALALTAPCGRTIVAGSLREPVEVDVYRDVHRKGVTLIGVHGSTQRGENHHWTERENRVAALDFISDRRLPVAALISHRLPAVDASVGFDLIEQRKTHGVILDWD